MFTGLIETMGTVAHLQKLPGGARLTIRVPQIAAQLELGDSISVNGCCLTVVEHDETTFTADLVPESLARTNLGVLAIGSEVNLERAMSVGDRLGGHWVQGHIDCLGQVRSRKRVGNEDLLEITVPFEITRHIVPQGSISLDGVSLTVVDVGRDRFRVALIPHTRELTTLGKVQPMDVVNIELDVLAKYVEKHLSAFAQRLPRMLRDASAQAAAQQPQAGPRTITPPADAEPAAVAPIRRTMPASHAMATTATVKRDRPKVRRSAQPRPDAARTSKSATATPKPKAKKKPRPTATKRRTTVKRTAASAKPKRPTTSARTTTKRPTKATAKRTAARKTTTRAAARKTGRR